MLPASPSLMFGLWFATFWQSVVGWMMDVTPLQKLEDKGMNMPCDRMSAVGWQRPAAQHMWANPDGNPALTQTYKAISNHIS
jgi:hypothetical protein